MSVAAVSAPTAEALRHCEALTRSRARNFYYGLKLLPEPKRSAMYALYAWMRRADDLVDEFAGHDGDPGSATSARIDALREATSRAIAGDPPNGDLMWQAFAFTVDQFGLDGRLFHDMLAGQLDDVRRRRYRTFDELREYCYRVASTVGLLCIDVWGYSDPEAKDLAIERGIAFQLTNILRDFKEDFDGDRVYLPDAEFEEHGLTPQELRAWSRPDACRNFVEAQVTRAASYYARSAQLDDMIEPECRPTLWAMTAIYRGLLDKIGGDPAIIVRPKRVRLSCLQKTMIALRARTGLFNHG